MKHLRGTAILFIRATSGKPLEPIAKTKSVVGNIPFTGRQALREASAIAMFPRNPEALSA
jgi:hypothetical protein